MAFVRENLIFLCGSTGHYTCTLGCQRGPVIPFNQISSHKSPDFLTSNGQQFLYRLNIIENNGQTNSINYLKKIRDLEFVVARVATFFRKIDKSNFTIHSLKTSCIC